MHALISIKPGTFELKLKLTDLIHDLKNGTLYQNRYKSYT